MQTMDEGLRNSACSQAGNRIRCSGDRDVLLSVKQQCRQFSACLPEACVHTLICRLRKAIKHNVHDARVVEHDYAGSLNQQMVAKLSTTAGLKRELERQLAKLREEQAKVLAQRGKLIQAIDAKR